jgi:hypothetical protein
VPPRTVEGEETHASKDTPPIEGAGAALAPVVTEPPSTGGRSGAGRRPQLPLKRQLQHPP